MKGIIDELEPENKDLAKVNQLNEKILLGSHKRF